MPSFTSPHTQIHVPDMLFSFPKFSSLKILVHQLEAITISIQQTIQYYHYFLRWQQEDKVAMKGVDVALTWNMTYHVTMTLAVAVAAERASNVFKLCVIGLTPVIGVVGASIVTV